MWPIPSSNMMRVDGRHVMIDMYGCDATQINSQAVLGSVLTEAAEAGKMEVLHTHFHAFSPHGVTGVVLLSTSHIAVHTWPEYNYAAFDIFSCADQKNTQATVNHLLNGITHKKNHTRSIHRGYVQLTMAHS